MVFYFSSKMQLPQKEVHALGDGALLLTGDRFSSLAEMELC